MFGDKIISKKRITNIQKRRENKRKVEQTISKTREILIEIIVETKNK